MNPRPDNRDTRTGRTFQFRSLGQGATLRAKREQWEVCVKIGRTILFLFVFTCLLQSLCALADEKPKAGSKDDPKELELRACGAKDKEVNFTHDTDKKNHPTPAPAEGKAMVYVIRPTMMGHGIQTKLAVDGEWKGVNKGNNYFFFELEPGEHYFCGRAENKSVLTLTLEPGKTYFLQQHVEMGFMKSATRLELVSEDKGREKLAKLNLATWQVKKQGE